MSGSGNVDFGYVTVGEKAPAHFATVANTGDEPVRIDSLEATGPFEVLTRAGAVIEPGGSVGIALGFKGELPGAETGVLTVRAGDQAEEFPLFATVVPDVEGAVADYASVAVEPQRIVSDGRTTALFGRLVVAWSGLVPLADRDAVLVPAISNLPPDAELEFDPSPVAFGLPQAFSFVLRAPDGMPDFEFLANATLVRQGSEVFTYSTAVPIAWMAPPPQACSCPVGTPAATLNALPAGTYTGYFPNSPIAAGDGQGATAAKVASVSGEVAGPKRGECCERNARFTTTIRISSAFPLPGGGNVNNAQTGLQLEAACQGRNRMEITANSNGTTHGFKSSAASTVRCPTNPAGPAPAIANLGKVELETSYDVPITCSQEPSCPCTSAFTTFWTDVTYDGRNGLGAVVGGAGLGLVRVYWDLSVAAGNADCAMGAIRGRAVRMLFDRGGENYDPAHHDWGWLPAAGDQDGDGVNNVTEMHLGRDPTN